MSKIFIIATGTEVGKTLVTCGLCELYNSRDASYIALKPVISGFDFSNTPNDLSEIIEAQNRPYIEAEINNYAHSFFALPLSPDMAAIQENKPEINLQHLNNFISTTQKKYKNLIIEGIGGLMVPLNKSQTYLDFLIQNYDPKTDKIILVAGSYLGSLSHTLAALQVLQYNKFNPQSLVITQNLVADSELYIPVQSTINSLQNFYNGKIIAIENIAGNNQVKINKVAEILKDEKVF